MVLFSFGRHCIKVAPVCPPSTQLRVLHWMRPIPAPRPPRYPCTLTQVRHGSRLPFKTLVLVTLPLFVSQTVTFGAVPRPVFVLNWVLVVIDFPSEVRKWLISLDNLPLLSKLCIPLSPLQCD